MLYIARSFVILQLGNVGSIIQNLIQSCLKVFLVGLPNNSWIFLQHFFCRILPLFGSCLVVVSMKNSDFCSTCTTCTPLILPKLKKSQAMHLVRFQLHRANLLKARNCKEGMMSWSTLSIIQIGRQFCAKLLF